MVLRPARTESLSWESWDLPPVASHRYCGMRAEHIMAVFSDSTRAIGLSGYWNRRESITETNIHRKISTSLTKKRRISHIFSELRHKIGTF